MNIHNLKRMYNHVLTVPEELLSMSSWRKDDLCIEPECNTVGCVIGHCIVLDTSIIERTGRYKIDFLLWSERFTGLDYINDGTMWAFLFSSMWGTNTKKQILARIKEVIFEGKLPIEFSWGYDFEYLVTNQKYLDQTPFEL